ncbi:MAG: manganese-dependent inorganic pyrophosphatase [Patescibacteria group bacterium]
MIIVVGHKNPDSDSAVSALMMSRYLNKKGIESVAKIAGEANRETEYIFSFFEEKLPEMINENEVGDRNIFLVDHNDLLQSVAKPENVYGVLDHHLLSGIKTDLPIFFRIEPIGSTSSLVYKMMKESGMVPDKKEAGLLLAGVISDTLDLKSPTCTDEDRSFYQELSLMSGINTEELSKNMFEAKSDFSGKSMNDVICSDLKLYDFDNKIIGIGVAETCSLAYFKENEGDIIKTMKEIKKDKGLTALFFGVVDMIEQSTYFYPTDKDEEEIISKVFEVEKEGKEFFFLEGVSSRKKEIAPPIQRYFNN